MEIKINIKQILGILGSTILFVGVFAPIVSMPIMGSMNYFRNGEGDGVFILILAGVSLLLSLTKNYKLLWLTGGSSVGIMAYTFYEFKSRMSQVQSEMEADLAGNPFRGLADAAMQSVQMQWGWAVMMVGAALVIAAAAIQEKDEQMGTTTQTTTAPPESVDTQAKQKPSPGKPSIISKVQPDWTRRGKKYIKNGEYKEAVAALSNAITATPNDGYIYYMRAIAFSKMSDRNNAITDIQQAAKLGNAQAIQQLDKLKMK